MNSFFKILTIIIVGFGLSNIYSPFFSQNLIFSQSNDLIVSKMGDTLNSAWAGGINSAQISTMDLNFDQLEDIVIFDKSGNKILTFINSVDHYYYDSQYEKFFPKIENWMLLRDYNGDGKKDIFHSVSGGIGVWKNTSSNNIISFSQEISPYIHSLQYNFKSNLYVSKNDIPDINDIDMDGDLDVVTFSILGGNLEYHQNLSVDSGYGSDSLIFELKNACWGHFYEGGLTNTCYLFDTCLTNVNNPEFPIANINRQDSTFLRHAGSTVLSLDLNNDNVRDILLGDVSFANIVALYNDNKGVNMNTSFISQDTLFPNNSIPVDLYIYPGTFYEDVTFDGVKDLLASPATDNDTEDKESVWVYENTGTNSSPVFNLQSKNMFQSEMLDFGKSSSPILVDLNNDGLKDLMFGYLGEFDINSLNHYTCAISVYMNTGTAEIPKFEWLTDDYQNLSSLINNIDLFPAMGDLDNDGDLDAIVGDYSGYLHYLENTSSNSSVVNLIMNQPQMQDDQGIPIDIGYCAKPVLFDLDQDNDLDLVIGEATGVLNYYENIGGANSPLFSFVTDNFGGIDVTDWWTNIGSSSPSFEFINNELTLFVGSERGALYMYDSISNNLNGSFNLIDSNVSNLIIGPHLSPALGYLNNDSIIDMIAGNRRGGVTLFYGSIDSTVNDIQHLNQNKIVFSPNPTTGILSCSYKNPYTYKVINQHGKIVKKGISSKEINISNLSDGIYYISVINEKINNTVKIVKIHQK
ncbi:MAG: hypothetical protein CL846_03170 [Crocinitomicaceae bacterium]|nr:hypothetical protein [Crocinitomicaceae bacterium]|tara:strand:+ start:7647 stop:9890 length:2244 start_codon:yes stop_codon:yes gene_type:complete